MSTFIEDMESTRAKLQPLLTKWIERLVPGWDVSLVWHYDRVAEFFESAAWVTSDWRYLQGNVNINLPRMCCIPDIEWEGIVVHEITHILLCEMREWKEAGDAMAHEERVVTVVSRLLKELK